MESQECPVDVQLLASTSSWCGGTNPFENGTLYWDITTITFMTVGIANLDNNAHTLNRLNVTIHQYVSDPSGSTGSGIKRLKSESLTAEAGLPLVLYPGYYWQYNLNSEEQCQMLAKISIEVDRDWFEFYPYEMPKIGS